MLDFVGLLLEADEVVILIIPGKSPGTYGVKPLFSRNKILVKVPLEILESNNPILSHGPVNIIHDVVNTLIHGLDSALNHHLALKLPGLVLAGHVCNLLDKLVGFLDGNKLGGLDRIHQKSQLRQFKALGTHVVLKAPAHLVADNIKANLT